MKSSGLSAVDLVLLGGGHSHAVFLRKWGMNPLPGVRITLISPDSFTAYSGMLPGWVAGHYSEEEIHIDLMRLCRWAGVRFVHGAASGLDSNNRQVVFDDRPCIEYDFLSVNTGGAPCLDPIPGAAEFVVPIKPVREFHTCWSDFQVRAGQSHQPLQVGVVGAGAGGFEILLALNHALNGTSHRSVRHQLHWLIRDFALSGYPAKVQQVALQTCAWHGIRLHQNFEVAEVRPGTLLSANGVEIRQDFTVWCTEAKVAKWLSQSGLDCTQDGYIRVSDTLQSLSHPEVFAVGDVSVQVHHSRPRAGVFAVRQGPALFTNLRRMLTGKRLRRHIPQSRFLTLLSMGERVAIGSRGWMTVQGKWVWHWKHRIDTRFMAAFREFPDTKTMKSTPMPMKLAHKLALENLQDEFRCGGCGAKIAADVLDSVLAELVVPGRDDLIVGLADRRDVAVIQGDGRALAQSVDQIRSVVDDPWLFGRIAALHALSDLYATQSIPQSAMALVTLPLSTQRIMYRDLRQIMQGVVQELSRSGCALSGGHTAEGAETAVGLVVNGYAVLPMRNHFCEGDCLVLTKPLGVGVIMAAHMRTQATGRMVDAAQSSMLQSNEAAASIIGKHGVRRLTDVTGFGLLGHLCRLLGGSGMSGALQLSSIPALPGALALLAQGIRSSLHDANVRSHQCDVEGMDWETDMRRALLVDPQTSGGLLAILPAHTTGRCLQKLREVGYPFATCIGVLRPRVDTDCRVIFVD